MKVIYQTLGSPVKEITLAQGDTISKLMELAGIGNHYTAKVNGIDAAISTTLKEFNVVTFSEKIKGGLSN